MLDFDFDVVTGPSKATGPAPAQDQPPAEETPAATAAAPISQARSAGS